MSTSTDERGRRILMATEPEPELMISGPETTFEVSELTFDGLLAHSSVPRRPATSVAGGSVGVGSLGVLVDVALGYALVAARPTDYWSVSSEIVVEALDGLRAVSGPLRCSARVMDVDRWGGLAMGEVIDDSGEIVALCSQRGRFVPVGDGVVHDKDARFLPPPDGADLAQLIGTRPRADGTGLVLAVTSAVQNPLGMLHGGIALTASDLAAHFVVGGETQPWTTSSLHISYVRRVPAGSELSLDVSVIHRGRALAVADVVGSVDGKACTLARVTLQPG